MWVFMACRARTLPFEVSLKRFFAPEWVFIFGMRRLLKQTVIRRPGWREWATGLAGRWGSQQSGGGLQMSQIVMQMRWAGVTPEQYEEARSRVDWEGDPADGGVFHVAGFDESGLRVTDVWESP